MFLQPFMHKGSCRTQKNGCAGCSRLQHLISEKRPEPRVQEAFPASTELASFSNIPFVGEGWLFAIKTEMRFHVIPRCVPAHVAARRIGLTVSAFLQLEPELRQSGFPLPDPVTGNYDLRAIEAWLDRRSGLSQQASRAIDAADGFEQRLAQIG
jgi:hypothetical protein